MKRSKRMLTAVLAAVFTLSILQSNITTSKVHAATGTIIDPSTQYQTMDGWGTSLAWWAGQVGGWSDTNRRAIEDLVFGDQGLGLNIVRYNIGGGEDPSHHHMHPARQPEGFENADGTWNWSADLNQRKILKEAITNYPNVNIAEAQSNSPPYWMTASGCASGNTDSSKDNLRSDQYDNFADYLTEVVKHFKEADGINFQYIDPVNEPNTNYWGYGGSQEGCHFDPSSQQTILNKVADSLKAKGLDTKITGTDESSLDTQINTYNSFNSTTKNLIDRINVHTYSGTQRYQLRDLAQAENKKLYMSEYSTGQVNDDHNSIAPAVPLGNQIMRDLKDMGVNAWVIWQAVEDEKENDINFYNNTPRNPSESWGLIHGVYSDYDYNGQHFTKEQYFISKQYYVMAQFSKFIKKGYRIINANNDNVLAAMDPITGKIVIVATNFTNSDSTNSFDLSRFSTVGASTVPYRTSDTEDAKQLSSISITNKNFSAILPANSITTFVIEGSSYTGATGKWINDNVVGTSDNTFSYSGNPSGHWSYYNAQSGAYSSDVHYSNTRNDYYQTNFTGNKIKVYGTLNTDGGKEGISIDGGDETLVDCYSPTRTDNALLYTSPMLSNGAHSLKVRVTGDKNPSATNCYIVSDGVYVVTGDESTIPNLNVPSIKSLVSGPERLALSFTPVEGAASYKVRYHSESGDIDNTINTSNTSLVIHNLRGNAVYCVSVCAVINGQDAPYSAEMRECTKAASLSSVVYYVDCANTTTVSSTAGNGGLNSISDKTYGPDPVTGYSWGYDPNKVIPGWVNDSDPYKSIIYGDAHTAGQGINYTFEIPNGVYKVSFGFYDPWYDAKEHRYMDLVINGNKMKSEYVLPDNGNHQVDIDNVSVTNSQMTVGVLRSASATCDPIISWLKIVKIPQIATIDNINAVVIQNGFYSLPTTIEAKMEDGTTKQCAVTWDGTPDTTKAGNQVFNGTVQGYSGNVKLTLTVNSINININDLSGTVLKPGEAVTISGTNSRGETSIKVIAPNSKILYFNVIKGTTFSDSFNLPTNAMTGTYTVVAGQGSAIATTTFNVAISVNPFIYVSGITIDKGSLSLNKGASEKLTATVTPADATNKNVIWSSSNSEIATVDNNGNVTAVAPGTAAVTAKTVDGNKTAVCTVSVISPVVSVSLDKNTLSLTVGTNGKLTAVVTPSDASNKNVVWSSSNTVIVTVDNNGNVTAVAKGTATITVRTEDANKTAACTVTAVSSVVPVGGIALDKNTFNLKEGESGKLTASVTPADATNKNVIWSSSNNAVAAVDSNGNITAVAKGTAIITAKTEDGNKTATCTVTVESPVVSITGVTLDKSTLELIEGESEKLSATVAPLNATNKNITWSSNNTEVATVEGDGNVTAVAPGTATITVKTEEGSKVAECTVTVTSKVVHVKGVTLNKSNLSLYEGASEKLAAKIDPANATNKKLKWYSSNARIAKVDNNGRVTAVLRGNATITVKSEDGNKTASCKVTVNRKPILVIHVTGITLNKDTLKLIKGTGVKLTAMVVPANATNKNVTWSSSNNRIVTVDNNGNVKAISLGDAIITVKTSDGSKTATCRVKVTKSWLIR